MLALLGFTMVTTFMVLIMTKKLHPMVALILVPIIFGLIAGAGPEIGKIMLNGVTEISGTAVMLIFGILYFAIMIDVGLFDPLILLILKTVKGDPVKVLLGTAILTLIVSLDGDGATTYMIVVSAMLPLYKRLGIDPLKLTTIIMLCGGIMNILPWGGPTARAMSVLNLDTSQLFIPLIPCMIGGAIWVFFVAYRFGKQEQKRLRSLTPISTEPLNSSSISQNDNENLKKPRLQWVNLILTLLLMIGLLTNFLPLSILFMIGFAFALTINYSNIEEQRERFIAHAGNALSVGAMVFAAGIFTGILGGTKMAEAMATAFTDIIPDSLAPNLSVITALTSMPFTYFISNDAFYFGILPLLAETGQHFDISAAEIGRASLLGQPVHLLSPLVPSTYLLVGLAGVNFGDHQRHTLRWACGTVLVMLVIGICFNSIRVHFI